MEEVTFNVHQPEAEYNPKENLDCNTGINDAGSLCNNPWNAISNLDPWVRSKWVYESTKNEFPSYIEGNSFLEQYSISETIKRVVQETINQIKKEEDLLATPEIEKYHLKHK